MASHGSFPVVKAMALPGERMVYVVTVQQAAGQN